MLLGLDLAPRKCGWCVGTGETIPLAGGFRLHSPLEDLGGLLEETRAGVWAVVERFQPEVIVYESPILPSSGGQAAMGSTDQRRAQFSQGAFVEWLCLAERLRTGWGPLCQEEDVYAVKYALTGSKRPGKTSQAQKDAMVAAAERLGVKLPALKADGREDAADAVGAWLCAVRVHAPQHLPAWDQRVFKSRGALL